MSEEITLTVVVPAYNEAARLPTTLDRVVAYLDAAPTWLPAEVLVVDDGSRDGTSGVADNHGGGRGVTVRAVRLEVNRGKGAAVRTGMTVSRGSFILISDADLATPIEELETLRAAGVELAAGSRGVKRELIVRHQPILREGMGRIFNLILRSLALTPLKDTQCGFKLVEGQLGRKLARQMRLDGFAFDVELLARARQAGARVAEVPVHWYHMEQSRVQPVRHSLQMFRDVLKLRVWLWLGR
jgi:dolichyl-phosphate beta-glucosyltransferase